MGWFQCVGPARSTCGVKVNGSSGSSSHVLSIHVVSGSPKIVGDADSICCVMAGISTGIIVGATFLLAVWGMITLFVRRLVAPMFVQSCLQDLQYRG